MASKSRNGVFVRCSDAEFGKAICSNFSSVSFCRSEWFECNGFTWKSTFWFPNLRFLGILSPKCNVVSKRPPNGPFFQQNRAVWAICASWSNRQICRGLPEKLSSKVTYGKIRKYKNTKITGIQKVESVQRRFPKRLPGLAEYDHSSRLAILDLNSLESRRFCQDLLPAYKIICGLVNVDSRKPITICGHNYKLFASKCRVDVRKWFFNRRIVNIWNSLSATAECFASLSTFDKFFI
jgi:hypothetical protein